MKSFLAASLLVGTALTCAGSAWAATETDNLSVSATVTNECSLAVEAGGLAFGTLDPDGYAAGDANADVTLTCTTADASSANVTVDGGANLDVAQRRMKDSGTDYINYNLYSDSGYSTAIEVGGSLAAFSLGSTNPGGSAVTIYGRVPAGQTLAEGAYSDTIVLTTSYEPAP